MPTVDNLNIQIISSAKTAVSGIDALTASLGRLNATSRSGNGLSAVSKQINNISTASKGISSDSATKLQQLVTALQRLSAAGNIKISSSIGTQISKIGQAVAALGTTDFSAIDRLATGLAPLSTLGKSQLGSFISQLGKLPKLALELSTMDLTKFVSQIQTLAVAMTPLAEKMNAISAGFAALPTKIRGVVSGLNAATTAAPRAGSALGLLNTSLSGSIMKFGMFYMVIRRVKDVLASFITNSMEYTENLNLFNVAMGDFAEEAMAYGEKVQSVMGIDLSEWVRNQGIFMQLTTGFGIADASAASMSKTMTQLSYDLASLFNSDVETSMQKVQSGLAGELEPLRRWGYDLSVAKLQEVALSMGIDQRVISMTQADKAQLRFIAIMQQSNNAVGDMARTLITPANAMRIMSQLIERLKRALGNMLIPILTAVMPYVMAFTTVLIDAANALASLLGFVGVDIDYSNLGAGLSTTTDGLDGVTSSAGAATDAIKAFSMGFDQLNIVPDQNSGGSGGGGGGGGSDLGIDYSDYEYDFLANANTRVSEIVASMKLALAPLNEAFGKLGESLGPLLDQFKIFWDQYLVPFGIWTIGTGLPALVGVLTNIFTWFNDHPETTKTLAKFAAACLVLSKITTIAIGIKATLTGLGLLGPALMGTGGAAAAAGTLTLAATLSIAAASIAVAYIAGSLIVDTANKKWDASSQEHKDTITESGTTGDMETFQQETNKGFTGSNFLEKLWNGYTGGLGDSSKYVEANYNANHPEYVPSEATGSTEAVENQLRLLEQQGISSSKALEIAVGYSADASDALDTAGARSEKFANKSKEAYDGYIESQEEAQRAASNLRREIAKNGPIYDILSGKTTLFGKSFVDLTGKTDKQKQSFNFLGGSATDAGSLISTAVTTAILPTMGAANTNTLAATNGMKSSFSTLSPAIQEYLNGLSIVVNGKSTEVRDLLTGIIGQGTGNVIGAFGGMSNSTTIRMLQMAANSRLALINILDNMGLLPTRTDKDSVTAAKTRILGGSLASLPMFATGGFPDKGQMFIAREAGPEMVGSIGSRSAVANNSQIVQGITQGVAKGVAQAMSASSGNDGAPINIYFDNTLGYTISAAERRNARAGRIVVPMGGKS